MPALNLSPGQHPEKRHAPHGQGVDTADFATGSFTGTANGMTGGVNGSGSGTIRYGYTLTHAQDGQIIAANDLVNGNWAYQYDEFNRLRMATQTNSSGTVATQLSWDYDRYGNLWRQNGIVGIGTMSSASFNPATNRALTQLSYDIAGNVLSDGLHGFVYDGENRIAQVSGGVTYIYDAEGRRVGKSDGTVYTVNTGGAVLDEVNGSVWKRSEVTLGGHHLATVNAAGVVFVHGDWLGTERARWILQMEAIDLITKRWRKRRVGLTLLLTQQPQMPCPS